MSESLDQYVAKVTGMPLDVAVAYASGQLPTDGLTVEQATIVAAMADGWDTVTTATADPAPVQDPFDLLAVDAKVA